MHPTMRTPRRRLLRGLAVAAMALPIALGAAACGDDESGGSTDPNAPVKLSVFYWGSEARAKLTEEALNAYKAKHSNVEFEVTWQANQGYADKLATLAAGGDVPDLFALDDNMLADFATRNVTADLTEAKSSGKIDTSKFPPSLVEYGTVDGKFVGVAAGENTPGLVYNKTLVTKNGLPEPQTGWTWDQFIDWAAQVTTKTKVPGTMDPSADYKAFWVWLRQQGKDLYNGKQLGFTAEDLTKWFTLWKGARDKKATPTADVIHEGNVTDISKQLVVTGKAATSWVWANQMPELKKNTKDELGVVAYPGDPSGQWARAAMYWSVARSSEKKDTAIDVINFLVNDQAAVNILGTDRGLPSNLDLRTKFAETVTDPNMKLSIQLENDLASKFGKAPQVPPKGHSTFRSELVKAAENVQFGRATPEKAAADLIALVQPKLG
ncbi:ABC transporter substrate-binding protein [Phytohabitans rumicis]|uniref:Sugar ABC transporter substrate-binding protein n=1 Tax=Phytohabitans rumicis TaxID=1076125 RepID=A0A6V8L415_9ACTN|nr:extracellular solute-binding protein [Phytohabitans rumicis]GFJ90934.1 sugar ABC transporter substrate-binding protein [Phytohabitans rumicis]